MRGYDDWRENHPRTEPSDDPDQQDVRAAQRFTERRGMCYQQ